MYSRHAEQSMRGLPAQRFSGETRVVRRGAVLGRRNPVRRGAVQFLQARSVEERPFSIGTMTSVRNRTMCYLPKATGSRRSGRARSRLALPRHRSLPDPRRSLPHSHLDRLVGLVCRRPRREVAWPRRVAVCFAGCAVISSERLRRAVQPFGLSRFALHRRILLPPLPVRKGREKLIRPAGFRAAPG